VAVVEEEGRGGSVRGVENDHQTVDGGWAVRRVETRRHLHRVERLLQDVPGLHVDLPARLRHVEVDHARQLGPPGRVGDEGPFHRIDQRRHVEGRANVGLPEDQDLPAHGRKRIGLGR